MARPPTRSELPHPALRAALEAQPGVGMRPDELELGYISGIFGVQGEVRLFLHNHDSELLDAPRDVVLVGPDGARWAARMSARAGAGKRILGRVAGLSDREAASALQGFVVAVDKDALPALADDEFYLHEIQGLPVEVGGREVGRVVHVHQTPGADILEVDTGGGSEFLPCLLELGFEVDRARGVVRFAEGALDDT